MLSNIGLAYLHVGDVEGAESHLLRARALQEELGDRSGLGITLNNLGLLLHERGDAEGALAFYREALAIHAATGERGEQATTLRNMAEAHLAAGEVREAEALFARVVRFAEETAAATLEDLRSEHRDVLTRIVEGNAIPPREAA